MAWRLGGVVDVGAVVEGMFEIALLLEPVKNGSDRGFLQATIEVCPHVFSRCVLSLPDNTQDIALESPQERRIMVESVATHGSATHGSIQKSPESSGEFRKAGK